MPDEMPVERGPRAPLTRPTPITSLTGSMFAYRPSEDGTSMVPVERQTTCACGRKFTQMLMAPRELEALERMGHIKTFMRQIPECFVPVHCPRCERGQITRQAQIDEARIGGTYAPTLPDDRRYGT